MTRSLLGMWFWGIVTTCLCVPVIVILAWAVFTEGSPSESASKMGRAYVVLRDQQTIVAAIIAAGALAWSYFFQLGGRR